MSSEARKIPASTVAAINAQEWQPSFNPWLIAISVMLATFMEVLDTSVANVALPHIAGNLSASTDQATWVLTSYLVSNAIVLPATGWLSARFGRKRLLVFCIIVFTLSSLLCGAATSLSMLIIARVIQGAGGGALQPIAQATMLESFPPNKRGMAMAVYGMGVVVAPIIGPTLGGWITDNYSWRWVFYINIPVGIIAVLMSQAFVEDPPYIKNSARRSIDYIGFGIMALWLASLQIMLDKGQDEDWFSSSWITSLAMYIRTLARGIRRLGTEIERADCKLARIEESEFRSRHILDNGRRHSALWHDCAAAALLAEPDGLPGIAERHSSQPARTGFYVCDDSCRAIDRHD